MFNLFNNLLHPYYAPVDAPIAPTGEMGKEDIIEFLGEDDEPEVIPIKDKEPVKEKVKEEKVIEEPEESEDEDEESEDDELVELETELEGPTEEQLELTTPVRRKEILKKYPELFKDFPYLEKAYYREQQFTELLPTIEDAKNAIEKADILDKFENDLMEGNTSVILEGVKKTDPKAFAKIIDDYLPALAKVDEKAYQHVIGNTIKHTIVAMVQEGRRSENESLQMAASILNQFVFGTSEFIPIKKLSTDVSESPKDNDRENQLSKREQDFVNKQFNSAKDELNTRVNNILKTTITANIDPKGSMTDYVKRNASREATEMLETLIEKDTRFKVIIDKLWEKVVSNNFNKSSVDNIRLAYISKAKTLLPSVIKKARNDALKGMGKRVSEESEPEEKKTNFKKNDSEQPRSKRSGHVTKPEDIPRGMKTLDFLMQD